MRSWQKTCNLDFSNFFCLNAAYENKNDQSHHLLDKETDLTLFSIERKGTQPRKIRSMTLKCGYIYSTTLITQETNHATWLHHRSTELRMHVLVEANDEEAY